MEDKKCSLMNGTTVQRKHGRKAEFMQVLICIIANTALLSSGMTLGFTSIALPFMEEPNDVVNVTISESSWIASVATISTPIGCLISGPLLDTFGRKFSLLLINVPALMGWLCIAINPTLVQIYIGRFLTGLACGLSSVPATVYIAESSTASMRGFLVTGTSISISLGVAIVYTLGLFLQERWQTVAFVCSAFPVVACILTCFVPESPVWLLAHKKPDNAKRSLMILRATKNPDDVQHEFEGMIQQANKNKKKPSTMNTLKAFAKPESYKPLLLMNIFFLFQQLTGTFVVIFYAVAVVNEAGVTTDAFVVAVLIGVTRFCFSIVAAWMSRRFGRRPTALTSGIGMTISLMVLATHLLIQHQQLPIEPELKVSNASETLNISTNLDLDPSEKPPNFLPVIMILIYISSSTIGFLTLPWSMIGEVFPAQTRGIASGFTTSMTYLFSFVAVKLYPYMIQMMQKHGVFYFYGVMALYGTVFVFFFLPETQGKTLDEIENYFSGRRKLRPKTDEEEALNSTKMVTIVSSQEKKVQA